MSAYYLEPADFSRFLDGLRGERTVRGLEAVYVDGPELKRGHVDLVFDQPGYECFDIRRGGKEDSYHTWVLTETRQGKRIDLKWERITQAVVYEHEGDE